MGMTRASSRGQGSAEPVLEERDGRLVVGRIIWVCPACYEEFLDRASFEGHLNMHIRSGALPK